MCFLSSVGFMLGASLGNIPVGTTCPIVKIVPYVSQGSFSETQTLPLSLENIEERALAVTVRIIASGNTPSATKVRNAASGVLLSKRNTTYFVITNKHILSGESNIQVVTSDGKSHRAALVESVSFPLADLVLLSFQTNITYPTARLGLTGDLKIGDWVFATGFPKRSQSWKFAEGQYALAVPKPIESGYAFGYTSAVEIGMSGGAVMDAYGRVIAINGVHSKPLWGKPTYVYDTGEKPCETMREEMASLSWAIPMETVVKSMPDLRMASLEAVQTTTTFPNTFAATKPSAEFWQWRASLLNKCVSPLPSLLNLAWGNAVLPSVTFPLPTFPSPSVYSQAYTPIHTQVYPENYMPDSNSFSSANAFQFDQRSLANVALTFSFTLASTVISAGQTNAATVIDIPRDISLNIPQPVKTNSEDAPAIAQMPQPNRVNTNVNADPVNADQMARAQILLAQAQTFFDQGLYDRSMTTVNQAIELNPNNPLAWQLLGNCLKKMGRDQDALTAYDQAFRLLSVTKEPATNSNNSNSPQVFTQSVGSSTNDIAQLWAERARTLDRLSRYQESISAYDQALRIRCQEQLQRFNEPFPAFCQNYLLPASGSNNSINPSTSNEVNRGSVVIPVAPSQQPSKPSNPPNPNRGVW